MKIVTICCKLVGYLIFTLVLSIAQVAVAQDSQSPWTILWLQRWVDSDPLAQLNYFDGQQEVQTVYQYVPKNFFSTDIVASWNINQATECTAIHQDDSSWTNIVAQQTCDLENEWWTFQFNAEATSEAGPMQGSTAYKFCDARVGNELYLLFQISEVCNLAVRGRSVQSAMEVIDASTEANIATVFWYDSDLDGVFEVTLPPGEYWLHLYSGSDTYRERASGSYTAIDYGTSSIDIEVLIGDRYERRVLVDGEVLVKTNIPALVTPDPACGSPEMEVDLVYRPSNLRTGLVRTTEVTYAIWDNVAEVYVPNVPAEVWVNFRIDSGGHCGFSYAGIPDLSVPLGGFYVEEGSTGANGLGFTAVHKWPEHAGLLDVVFFSVAGSGQPFELDDEAIFTYAIIEDILEPVAQGLSSLDGYELIGTDPRHPSRWNARPETITQIMKLASQWHEMYPARRLGFNDMSLPWGGRFNISDSWESGGHKSHRDGRGVDLRVWDLVEGGGLSIDPREDIGRLAIKLGFNIHVHWEEGDFGHWHLTFPKTPPFDVGDVPELGAVSQFASSVPGLGLSVSVSQQGSQYVYDYTLAADPGMNTPVESFSLLGTSKVGSVESPVHWDGTWGFSGQPTAAGWIIADHGPLPEGWVDNGTNLYASTYAPMDGSSVAGFRIVSSAAPGQVPYYFNAFADIDSLPDDESEILGYFDGAPDGFIAGPASTASAVPLPGVNEYGRVLSRVVPNPFNPRTEIEFTLPQKAAVSLKIYDVTGRLIRDLCSSQEFESGSSAVTWNGKSNSGERVPSAVYFYFLESEVGTARGKLMLIK